MGEPGTLESYIVPFVGQELPTNEFVQARNPQDAQGEGRGLLTSTRISVNW